MLVLQGTVYAAQLVAGSDLTGATVTATVTAPDLTSSTYTAGQVTIAGFTATVNVPASQVGTYLIVWSISGTVSGGMQDQFTVRAAQLELISITDLRNHLNIADTSKDDKLRDMLPAAGDLIENVTGVIRPTTVTEVFDGGASTLLLSAHHVTSVTSVTEWLGTTAQVLTAQTAADPSDGYGYMWNRAVNTITRRSYQGWVGHFAAGTQSVQVVYIAGMATIPGDIQLACARLISHWYRKNESPFRAGSFTGTADDAVSMPGNYMLPNEVMELLEPYRRPPGVA